MLPPSQEVIKECAKYERKENNTESRRGRAVPRNKYPLDNCMPHAEAKCPH